MTQLKTKLSRLKGMTTPGKSREKGDLVAFRRQLRGLGRGRRRQDTAAPADQGLPGEWLDEPAGRIRVQRQTYDIASTHGRESLGGILKMPAARLGQLALDATLDGVDPGKVLFLDTETTGLAGGCGTLPFLVGVAGFRDGRLWMEQLLLPSPGQERPMLQRLAGHIAAADYIASYNGKSYDWPLLKTRFVMNRLEVPSLGGHLDLLHCCRRLFGGVLDTMKLTRIEEEILGFQRQDDIPGSMIPDVYFNYLKTGNADDLRRVLEHNAHDLLALAAVIGLADEIMAGPKVAVDPAINLAVAKLLARNREPTSAMAFVEAIQANHAEPLVQRDAVLLGATLCRRRKDYGAAQNILQAGLGCQGLAPEELAPLHLMLAKLYEHRFRDLDEAMLHARGSDGAEPVAMYEKRLGRLARKLGERA